ncbi:MAG: homogentisate 1,2-dioxygenase [Pirellulales bacterium]|nr:homogentisate 1,2-dioxygenase [Pirellulales bacterium]
MTYYHRLGELPRKRHTIFRQPGGELYSEHLMSNLGFSGAQSLLYHSHPPTTLKSEKLLREIELRPDPNPALRMRHFQLAQMEARPSPTLDRTPILYNGDAVLSFVLASDDDEFFYRNGQADEIVYISDGGGVLESEFGELTFRRGDYLVIPRGILHRYKTAEQPLRLLVIESTSHVRPPSRYCNQRGQFLEHSPYCERDIRPPERLPTYNESGEFRLIVKQRNVLTEFVLDHHPLDVVGWDGCFYPWALSIQDFEPNTGSLHQPPPVHQTFQSDGFVVCSFVPRLFDFHPEAIPAPYAHSNVMSDEVLYYANDEFMSRKGISYGSFTLHPAGIPHGPHPGKTEASIGQKRTEELAVMVDSFRPFHVAADVLNLEDKDYARSWLD